MMGDVDDDEVSVLIEEQAKVLWDWYWTAGTAFDKVVELDALIQGWLAEAWDEGHRLSAPHGDRCEPTCPNPYGEAAP